MKIAIYARVSDDKLTDEGLRRQDVNRQIEKIRTWINLAPELKDMEIEVFCDDGKSAFKEDYSSRPAFCELRKKIFQRQIKRVIVEDLSRWSRRLEEGLRTMKEAYECGCTITSLAEGEVEVTTPEGWFRCAIAFMFAEWAARSQSWKVKSGMMRAKAAGKHVGRPKKGRSEKGEVKKTMGENPTLITASS